MENGIPFRRITDRIGHEMNIDTFESFSLFMDSVGVVSIQGCKRVQYCSNQRIELIGYDRIVIIEGDNMQILLYSKPETIIKGYIQKFEFLKGEKNA